MSVHHRRLLYCSIMEAVIVMSRTTKGQPATLTHSFTDKLMDLQRLISVIVSRCIRGQAIKSELPSHG